MTRHGAGLLCLFLGGVCAALALGLTLWNLREERQTAAVTEELLPALARTIEIRREQPAAGTSADSAIPGNSPEKVETTVEVDGARYLGYLTIPALDLQLPVRAELTDGALRLSPCRYSGTAEGGGLVIAAHNYREHFAALSTLKEGDAVYFTDADGVLHVYAVSCLETLNAAETERMTGGGWDLTLFTCTYSGRARLTVRCTRMG